MPPKLFYIQIYVALYQLQAQKSELNTTNSAEKRTRKTEKSFLDVQCSFHNKASSFFC